MALAGTNHSCRICTHEHWQHYEHLCSSFKSTDKFQQPVLPSFPCPILLRDGNDSHFGKGDCLGCVCVCCTGITFSRIATLENSSYELLDALREATHSSTFDDLPESFKNWWDQLVMPLFMSSLDLQTPLSTRLPKRPFFLRAPLKIGNSLSSCNVQSSSCLLTICHEAFLPLVQQTVIDYCLLLPSEIPSLNLNILTSLAWPSSPGTTW